MSFGKSIGNEIVSNIYSSIEVGKTVGAAGILRYFAELEAPLQSHYKLAKPIIVNGNFEIEFYFIYTKTGGSQYFLDGDVSDNRLALLLDSAGENLLYIANMFSSIELDGTALTVGATSTSINGIDDNKIHHLKLTGTATNARLALLGVRFNFQEYFQGYLFNPIVNGTKFTLDNASDMNSYGANIWTYGDAVTTGEPAFTRIGGVASGGTNLNATVRWKVEVTGLTSGEVRFRVGDDVLAVNATADGIYEGKSNSGNNTRLDVITGGTAPNAGVTVKVHYAQEATKLVDNTIEFSEDTTFGAEAWSYGQGVSTGAEGTFHQLAGDNNGATTDTLYAWEVEVTNLTAGELRFRVGDDTTAVATSENGTFFGVSYSGSNTRLDVVTGWQQPNAGATITVKSVKPLVTGNAITYVNIPDSNMKQYKQDGNDWVGVEPFVATDFEDMTDWAITTPPWTVVNGQAISDGSSSGFMYTSADRPSYYRVEVDAASIPAGDRFQIYDGAAYSLNITQEGVTIVDVVNADSSYNYLMTKANTGDEVIINSIKAFTVLKGA